ncbi:hypothetical protein HDU93_002355 [Gonapodya sp. JEL0774]|nr:hypothetical protein HDU93_002355 [Gonapodya sp. JEL0774]
MELLAKFGNAAQKEKWLKPLMEGTIRSTFAMTEPGVASSDATNISTSITKTPDGKHYIINGHKHWQSNFSHPDTRVLLLVGKTRSDGPKHGMLSVVILPKDTPGIKLVRHMTVYGYDHAPSGHDELIFENCKVPAENLVLGEGRGFDILQGRLGGGRIHHAMRTLGVGQRALELMLIECINEKKKPFGITKGEQGKVQWDIAQSRIQLEQCKQLVYMAAKAMDIKGLKEARYEIAMAKIAVPYQVCQIIDRAMQVYGGLGVSQSTELAHQWAMIRHLRFADGPDEAHAAQLARTELKNAAKIRDQYDEYKRKEHELRKSIKSVL